MQDLQERKIKNAGFCYPRFVIYHSTTFPHDCKDILSYINFISCNFYLNKTELQISL